MSAFMVSKPVIDALVCVVDEGPERLERTVQEWKDSIHYSGILPEDFKTPLDDLGDMLVRENLSSIHYRYPDTISDPKNTPGPIEQYWAQSYIYQRPDRKPTAVEAYKLIDHYEYQACEHPEWETSSAKKVCTKLRELLISALPGYQAAPWGWDE
jgi:hypothetical protein